MSGCSADPAPKVPAGAQTTAAIPATFQMETMRLGQRDPLANQPGQPVAMTQYLLKRWSPGLAVDGSFGYGTKSAVEAFQRAERLAVTGKLTRNDFYRLFVRQTVRYGSTGDAVRAVQAPLNAAYGSVVAIDGTFGSTTRGYVQKAQREHGAEHGTGADGIVGPLTRAMLYAHPAAGPGC